MKQHFFPANYVDEIDRTDNQEGDDVSYKKIRNLKNLLYLNRNF